MPSSTRRDFLLRSVNAALVAPLGNLLPRTAATASQAIAPLDRAGWQRESSIGATLRAGQRLPLGEHVSSSPMVLLGPETRAARLQRFSDLRRHFVFEYYPWYGARPYVHWDQWERRPPIDLATNYVPRLRAYDSRNRPVLEQHARWIADSGAGTLNLSWWGRDSFEEQAVPLIMDVMRDHDLKVTFHLEPYTDDHGARFADDVLYLLRTYGEKRRFDTLLLLRDAAGNEGPLFKGFRMILPREYVDCHGNTRAVADYTDDDDWRRELDGLRNTLSKDFQSFTLLCDTLDMPRAQRSGFDGVAVYDNFIRPETYAGYASVASAHGLTFSFNVNPGYDQIEPRSVESDSCYQPTPFAPPTTPVDWARNEERERAAKLSEERIRSSFDATLEAQLDPALVNDRRGFLLVYLTSFNEWHEGHQFEPMLDAADLTGEERRVGYHNPARGDGRFQTLKELLRGVQGRVEAPLSARA
jgi:Glycosyl hydrolase family 99